MGIAEFVELEQFGRQRLAARMSLTLVLVDVYFQFSGHGKRSLRSRASWLARMTFPVVVFVAQPACKPLGGAVKLYHITFQPRLYCQVKTRRSDAAPISPQSARHLSSRRSSGRPGAGGIPGGGTRRTGSHQSQGVGEKTRRFT